MEHSEGIIKEKVKKIFKIFGGHFYGQKKSISGKVATQRNVNIVTLQAESIANKRQ